VDASRDFDDFPRTREAPRVLSKAGALILTKCQNLSGPELETLRKKLPTDLPIFEAESVVVGLRALEGGDRPNLSSPLGLVSGLAHPQSFEDSVRKLDPSLKIKRRDFPDHHPFSLRDVEGIESWAREEKIPLLLITEKDEVKIKKQVLQLRAGKTQTPRGTSALEGGISGGDDQLEDSRELLWAVLGIETKIRETEIWHKYLKDFLREQ
jgi:tetraacyldisaccharide-1-P 4'-kinase